MNATTAKAIHVGVNAHLLSLADNYRSAGINRYIYQLLAHLAPADPAMRYTVFLSEQRYIPEPGLGVRVSRMPTHRPPVRIIWEQMVQPWALRRAGVDLVHQPAYVGAWLGAVPFVVTVHDLSFLHYPHSFRAFNRMYLQVFTQSSVRRAQRVIAVSESTKRDIVQQYGLPASKIDVVYNGVDPAYRPLPVTEVKAFKHRHGLPDRFLLFVGTLEPRKNVVRLIEAYAKLPSSPPLMLVGGKGWLYEEIFARIQTLGLTDKVRLVGFVPASDLPLWYNAAHALVYPSLYEGFGLPALEAMACGTLVITSTASSMPEVVGQAGILVDPEDVDALAEAMNQVLADPDDGQELRAAGLKQAQKFSWASTAHGTVQCYRQAIGGKARV